MDEELPDSLLDALERVARQAAPGPWAWVDAYTLADAAGATVLTKKRNREFIAALPPELVLRLVDEVRFLRRLEQMRARSTAPPGRKSSRPPARGRW